MQGQNKELAQKIEQLGKELNEMEMVQGELRDQKEKVQSQTE